MKSRPYQSRTHTGVLNAWQSAQSVCLVCPTGGGKTYMGVKLALEQAGPNGRILWVAHRRELVMQAIERIQAQDGVSEFDVAPVLSNRALRKGARIQVGTVQTILARKLALDADVLVMDEAHHYVSDNWRELHTAYPNAKALGLTATPMRADSKPLGDIFERLIVAAQYSELIEDGHLCEAVTYRPPEQLTAALAVDPLSAWEMYANGKRAFVFLPSVKLVNEWTAKFNADGVRAEAITGKTSNRARDEALSRFRDGTTKVLLNVDVLTEGVDVPEATAVILARAFHSVSAYMQAGGRVLRPHPDKRRAIIIDLTGCTHKHGLATEDRVYSLEGDGIRRASDDDLTVRNCLKCGVVYQTPATSCPACGEVPPPRTAKPPKIYSLELEEVWDGERTPDNAKATERERLIGVARSRGWSFQWAIREYKKTFGEDIVITEATRDERRDELARLQVMAADKGWRAGYAASRYKAIFGRWP